MIAPNDIRKAACRSYPGFLSAWVRSDLQNFFPLKVRASLAPVTDDLSAAIAEVARLRAGSKDRKGHGYSIHWRRKRSWRLGNNLFPGKVTIDTAEDLLWLSGKQAEFAATRFVAERIRDTFPALDRWVSSNVRLLANYADSIDGLLEVSQFFLDHPWPDCYARQIPVNVDTKFVGRHQRILSKWLNDLLPAYAIQADEKKFPLRFGLRDGQPHTTIRFLDPSLRAELGFHFDELSIPPRSLATLSVREATVLIVENQLNLLTLPGAPRALAIRGEGSAVTRLRQLIWLAKNQVIYWGDIDVEGFQILSSLRTFVPDVKSMFMSDEILREHRELTGAGRGATPGEPVNLTDEERAAFRICRSQNLRLEQERIPQTFVDRQVRLMVE